jgi:hypothetical protein
MTFGKTLIWTSPDDVLSRLADQPVRLEDVVSHGSPWGELE